MVFYKCYLASSGGGGEFASKAKQLSRLSFKVEVY